MQRSSLVFVALVGLAMWVTGLSARASQHVWYVPSPDHGQTYAYGSEQNRVWKTVTPNNHLALYATYNNEPFAEGSNRRYDNFIFNFPNVTLGSDGQTFFYHAGKGLALPVAAKHQVLFGLSEIRLLPTSYLLVKKAHGYLTLTLVVGDRPMENEPGTEIGILH